jgi:glycogen debranching enzyme
VLVRRVGELLGDDVLMAEAAKYQTLRNPKTERKDTEIYYSPACPHCNQLIGYLDANGVVYGKRNVVESEEARKELVSLTGKLAIPVVKKEDVVVQGFDKSRLRELLAIDAGTEKTGEYKARERIPTVAPAMLKERIEEAKALLEENRFGESTRASRHLYPHQWNWDAGFIARGYLRFAPEKAYAEIRSLFRGQWSNGFVPHIVFNPSYLDHFPGPDYWQAKRSGHAPEGVHTSGIGQPPVHASMMADAQEIDPDRKRAAGFLKELYPLFRALHEYYFSSRDPGSEGLVYLVHPWESGLDNSPLWDETLARITRSSPWARKMREIADALASQAKRPKRGYFEKYSYLVHRLFSEDYDWRRIGVSHPFRVQDVLFNSVLCKAERDLGRIARLIGRDSERHYARAERIATAMNQKLWDPEDGLYYSYDMVTGKLIKRDTIFSYIPLYADICSKERAARLVENLKTHCFCVADRSCVGIPSYDMCQVDYDGEHYWRGPIWFNMGWYMVRGLRRYSEEELADWLSNSLLKLVLEHGFYEYFEPETGKGLGADGFSWTASLFLDLAAASMKQPSDPHST